MNIKLLTALAIALPLFTVACAKKEAPAEGATSTEAPADEAVTPEQQAAIDSVDQPNPEAIAVEGEEPTASVETTETVTTTPVATGEADPAAQAEQSTEAAQ